MKQINKIVIGTAQFGLDYGIANNLGKMKFQEIKKIINFARLKKIKNIDTANAYGDCEERLGKVGIKDFNIIIKLPATNPTYPYNSWVDKSLKNSFHKLRIKKADTVLVHNASFLINKKTGNKIMNQLEKYKKKKIIKKIGVSVYSISDLRKVIKKYKIDTVLISLNVFDQRVLEDKVIKNLKK